MKEDSPQLGEAHTVREIEGGGYGDINLNFLIPPNLDLTLA